MLNLKSLIAPTTILVAAFTLAASPSFAQERYHGKEKPSGQASSGQSTGRAQPRSDAPTRQGAAPRVETRQEAPRAQQPRATETPRADSRQNESRQNNGQAQGRQGESRRNDSRGYDNRGSDNRGSDNRGYDNRHGGYAPHYEPRYAPRYSPYMSAPRSYYRPYVFRPRFSIGFGIFAGFPVPYAYTYGYPIMVYGYRAPRERVMVAPGSAYYGGVALEMTPYDADVFVDGQYAGKVQDFDGTTQPLTLAAGAHQIEVRAPGFETMMVNVEIQAGQVIPYRGDLRRF